MARSAPRGSAARRAPGEELRDLLRVVALRVEGLADQRVGGQLAALPERRVGALGPDRGARVHDAGDAQPAQLLQRGPVAGQPLGIGRLGQVAGDQVHRRLVEDPARLAGPGIPPDDPVGRVGRLPRDPRDRQRAGARPSRVAVRGREPGRPVSDQPVEHRARGHTPRLEGAGLPAAAFDPGALRVGFGPGRDAAEHLLAAEDAVEPHLSEIQPATRVQVRVLEAGEQHASREVHDPRRGSGVTLGPAFVPT